MSLIPIIPTPPSFGEWLIHLESQEEGEQSHRKDDNAKVELPGLGNCSVVYIDSQATNPPETVTQSLTLDPEPETEEEEKEEEELGTEVHIPETIWHSWLTLPD